MRTLFFKLFLLLAFFLNTSSLYAGSVQFPKFIKQQMDLVQEINDANASQASIQAVLKKQELLYSQAVDQLMINRSQYLEKIESYESEIFALKKIITINKRADNKYAVMRDEVALKSYLILRNQNKMIKSVLMALDSPTLEVYEEKLNKITIENQNFVNKLATDKYREVLDLTHESRLLAITQKNIRDFYLLKDVDMDTIGYFYKYESKMYRLNKYAKYHLISSAITINSLEYVQLINPRLEKYGLSVMKLFFIFLLIVFIYIFRKIVYVWLEKSLLRIDFLKAYSEDILNKLRKPIEILIIIININMIFYVYNDFSSDESVSKIFNIIYGFYFTLFFYKTINTVATVKLEELSRDSSNVQNDLINVGIKIINFIIIVIGILIMMFFAGVNLTAVLSGLGIGGFAVAFAAKDTISNFFGTLSILFSDVFSQGDWIEIDGKEGVVVELGLRVTTIRTFDNALIAIPNGTFASNDIKNWNKRILGRRIKMHIGVKYDSKSEDIQNAVEQMREMLDRHPKIATKATKYTHRNRRHNMAKLVSKDDLEGVKNNLLVYLDEFSDSSINILVYCFSKSTKWSDWLETKEDVMHKIMAILEENSLEFAFPSLSLYHENQLPLGEK